MSVSPDLQALPFLLQRRPLLGLFLVSVLGLFLELMLIRWIATEIRIFAYLQNTVLVVCFLGLGMGCWTSRRPIAMRSALVPLALLLGLLSVPFTRSGLAHITSMLSVLSDYYVWVTTGADNTVLSTIAHLVGGSLLTLGVMYLLWATFVPLGQFLGRMMDEHPHPIMAYSVNVFGSLVGIWLFVGLSAWQQPPPVWCAVLAVLAIPFLGREWRIEGALLLAIFAASFLMMYFPDTSAKELDEPYPVTSTPIEVRWSPYQKLYLKEYSVAYPEGPYKYLDIEVNNTSYQTIHDLSDAHLDKHAYRYGPELRGMTQYDVPLLFKPKPERMLVVGAGSGNDVAGGLRHGAGRIVAVDIDPAIVEMGRQYHPEKPYQSDKVEVVINDARAYFANSTEKFDLILFGLLDSHTTAATTNTRLDHFVYTRESLEQAKKLLADDGLVALSFYVERDYIADRMAHTLKQVFGHEPMSFRLPTSKYGRGGYFFLAGNPALVAKRLQELPRLDAAIKDWKRKENIDLKYTTVSATDDWPYLYLQQPGIPTPFLLLGVLLVLLALYGARSLQTPRLLHGWGRTDWHFFFLGAAFMLLETQNITKAAVVLGSTWEVNAVIISAILFFVLLANAIAAKWPRLPLALVYACLIGSCLGLYFLDLSLLASLPYFLRAMAVGGLSCLPILFSGIVFIRSFAPVPGKDVALGANLVGSLVGGVLQCITFLIGLKALLLMVAVLYAMAFMLRPKEAFAASEAVK